MKRLVVGMSALCASAVTFAQAPDAAPEAQSTSLKIYGVADIALAHYSTSGESRTAMHAGGSGSRIGFLKKDEAGVVQFWTVSPNGGPPTQVTHNPDPVASAFTWHPDGRRVAFVLDNSVCVTDVSTGTTTRLTPRCDDATAPRPEACVISPDGSGVAFVRLMPTGGERRNQICVVTLD